MVGDGEPGYPPEVLDRLQAELQDPVTLRKVVGFTWKRLRVLGLRSTEGKVHDIVSAAIADTADGKRRWNPDKRKLSTHLCWIVRDRTWKSLKKKKTAEVPIGEEEREENRANSQDGEALDTADAVIDADLAEKVRTHLYRIAREADDQEAELVLMAVEDGAESRQEIADMADLTPEQVTNAQKRLARMTRALPDDLAADAKEWLRK